MFAVLFRNEIRSDCIRGALLVNGGVFQTLERPWQDNARNVSCIPQGWYRVTPLDRSASGRYHDVWHVEDVPDRAGILIHAGNLPSHTKGCILIGLSRGSLSGQPAVLNSRTALDRLNRLTQRQPFDLQILGGNNGRTL